MVILRAMNAATATPKATSSESSLWQGTSSQLLNLGPFAVCLILAVAIIVAVVMTGILPLLATLLIPLGYAVWRYLVVRCRVFMLTCERLRITDGVINQHLDEVELYRVKDILMTRAWWMRLTGLSTITLITSERALPEVVIPAVRDGHAVREKLRKQVELRRDAKRVREMDFDSVGNSADDLDGDLPMEG